ncbi:DUF4079 domain-containing protein [Microcoleus asticus]|uniref:DUF4079 domain-containing protein n=1 Tax=Microcoleus asticus IPMA8 TaxID=2563858 RepID=A0ABX2CQF0_9CYAN|nr:DUF4079 domain-containing protein [Microcoleus asticus]NQE32622.1 hypothetical protein [Microcoleus asticus IPMA8]
MEFKDFLALLHPILAVAIVFPMLGIVLNMAWQTMQRRKQIAIDTKSKIPPVVGQEHVKAGRILSASVVGVTLLGLAYPIFEHILSKDVWSKNSFQVIFIILMFVATIASLVMLYRATPALWRGIFATLTGTGLVILGTQDGVYRLTNEWYWSHYYIGITAALIMVFSLAIIQDIYKDRSNRWRTIHVILNSIAVLLFLGQGMTGTRDLLQIPLNWQKPYIYSCDFANKTCPKP